MNQNKLEEILPENSKEFQVDYSVESSINGVEWVIKLKVYPEQRVYQERLHLSTEEIETAPLEITIDRIEEALHQVITNAVREEMFVQHVNGNQKTSKENIRFEGNSRLEVDFSSVDSVSDNVTVDIPEELVNKYYDK